MSNQTWELVEPPNSCKPISSKGVFKKKLGPNCSIDKYRVTQVIRGFEQKKGIDYLHTCYLVTKIGTIRTLDALAATHGLLVHQADVKTTFLNGYLEEEIYMSQLPT